MLGLIKREGKKMNTVKLKPTAIPGSTMKITAVFFYLWYVFKGKKLILMGE
jgi:hypothetical protein